MRRGFARGLRNEEITEMLTDDDTREERHYVLPPAGDQDSEDEGHGDDGDREEGEPNHPPIPTIVFQHLNCFQMNMEALQLPERLLFT